MAAAAALAAKQSEEHKSGELPHGKEEALELQAALYKVSGKKHSATRVAVANAKDRVVLDAIYRGLQASGGDLESDGKANRVWFSLKYLLGLVDSSVDKEVMAAIVAQWKSVSFETVIRECPLIKQRDKKDQAKVLKAFKKARGGGGGGCVIS